MDQTIRDIHICGHVADLLKERTNVRLLRAVWIREDQLSGDSKEFNGAIEGEELYLHHCRETLEQICGSVRMLYCSGFWVVMYVVSPCPFGGGAKAARGQGNNTSIRVRASHNFRRRDEKSSTEQ
jgi:hypothetical protein